MEKEVAGGIAGIMGHNGQAYMSNCYNKGVVKSIIGNVGGISYITPATTGSIVKNCYNVGNVSATEKANDPEIGGIVGTGNLNNTTVTNCYYLQGTCTGAINLKDTVEAPESRTAKQMQEDAFVTKLNEGNNETVWLKDKDNKNGGYPVLK